MTQKLINAIKEEIKKDGNTNIKIKDIRFLEAAGNLYALVNVTYTWWMNIHDKDVTNIDMIYVLIENEWISGCRHGLV